ncbi:MAG: hypothetical protein CL878_09760 [Dehalococcoidia bacterium]|nr:hypothetical protein [Dehalococcoidia bacterium]
MFNYASLQEIIPMLLYWAMGLYVLTRSPRSWISLVAAGTLFSVAAYFLHVAVHSNVRDFTEFQAWGGHFWWGGATAPALWYWASAIVLHREQASTPRWYRRLVAYPLGAVLALAAIFFSYSVLAGDALMAWSEPVARTQPAHVSASWRNLPGPLFPSFAFFMVVCLLVPLAHLAWVWRRAPAGARTRLQVRWLTVTGALFVAGAMWLVIAVLVGGLPVGFEWLQPGYGFIMAGLVILAWTVVRHGTWLSGAPERDDFLYYLSGQGLVVALYAGVLVVIVWAGLAWSLWTLLLVFALWLMVLTTHALADVGRATLGRLLFPEAWAMLVRRYGQVPDAAQLLREAQWWYKQTDAALQQLQNPSRLARSPLLPLLGSSAASPLERAHALAALIVASIAKLKPAVGHRPPRHYTILQGFYVEGHTTRHIMNAEQIPEKTYYNERKNGVAAVAEELRAHARAQLDSRRS